MNKKITDGYLLFLLILISVCGLTAVYTSVFSFEGAAAYVKMQSLAFAIGFVCFFVLGLFQPGVFKKCAPVIFIVSAAALIAVLIFGTGLKETGGQSWIRIGKIGFQPSEFVKIGFVITFAAHLSKVKDSINSAKTLSLLLLHSAVFIVLIALEPDIGTALVFVFITVSMLFFAGLSWKYFAGGGLIFAVSMPVLWTILKNYQKKRILVFLNPELDPTGYGYNVLQSKLALGSGKIFGQGFLAGKITQGEMLPSKHTDFIFSVIGEEFGLVGCAAVTVILLLIIMRLFTIGVRSKDSFSGLMSCGLSAMLLFHTVINIGMCMGLMPVTGIPLPFISYGGSSVIANFAAASLASSAAVHAHGKAKKRKR